MDLTGALARTDHPEVFGDRAFHPYIQTDFSETQIELITPVTDSVEELFQYLAAIYDVASRSISDEEMIWPRQYRQGPDRRRQAAGQRRAQGSVRCGGDRNIAPEPAFQRGPAASGG